MPITQLVDEVAARFADHLVATRPELTTPEQVMEVFEAEWPAFWDRYMAAFRRNNGDAKADRLEAGIMAHLASMN